MSRRAESSVLSIRGTKLHQIQSSQTIQVKCGEQMDHSLLFLKFFFFFFFIVPAIRVKKTKSTHQLNRKISVDSAG